MPVSNLFVGARIHVRTRLSSEEKHNKHGKEHHVTGKAEENKEPDAMKQFARAPALIPPVVVTTSATAASRAPIDGRLAADSWFFPFRFRWGVRKGCGHAQSSVNQTSVKMSILSLWLGRISKEWVVLFVGNRFLLER